MRSLLHDIIYGFRSMRRNVVSSTTAIVVLALGIGATTAVFSVVNRVLLEPLPYPAAHRLVQIFCGSPMGPVLVTSVPKFVAWREQRGVLQHVAAFGSVEPLRISIGGTPQLTAGIRVSADYFPVFGVDTIVGRAFTRTEDHPGGPPVALISHGMWRRHFGGNPFADRTLIVEDHAYEVIGVVSPGAPIDQRIDVWLPLRADVSSTDHANWLQVVGRLGPNVTPSAAARQLRYATNAFKKTFPDALGPLEFFTAAPLRDIVVGDARPALVLLSGAVAFVLLLACANVANLLLTQGNQRRSEFSLRVALGASRRRIIVQLLTENMLLSLAGGAAGLASGYTAVRMLLATHQDALPLVAAGAAISLDWRVLTFTVVVVMATTVLFGLYPALHGSRVDLASMLRASGSQSGSSRGHSRLRSALVVVQMACALVLLVGAGLALRTLLASRTVPPGFDPRGVLTLETAGSGLAATTDLEQFVRRAATRIEQASPDIHAAAVTSSLPLEPAVSVPFALDSRPLMGAAYHGMSRLQRVSHRYFDVFRIRLLAGRGFTEHDTLRGPRVAIVNAAFARKYWPNASPLLDRISLSPYVRRELSDPPRIIVGIVDDVRDGSVNQPEPMLYVPVAQVGDSMNAFLNQAAPLQWVVRTTVEPRFLSPLVQRELRASHPDLLVGRVQTMEEIVVRVRARSEFISSLLATFAMIALSLAGIGLYGLLAYSLQQRTREFGVRMALGADASAIRAMVLRQGIALALVGIAIGSAAAFALKQYMVSMIHGVSTADPVVFVGVVLLLTAVALGATLVSARRATGVHPNEALRHV